MESSRVSFIKHSYPNLLQHSNQKLLGYGLNCYQCLPNADECFENGIVNSENIITCNSEFNACYTSTIGK